MKIINFINPTNPQDERSCAIWFKCTLAALLITFAVITYIQFAQIRLWYACRQEYKQYNALTKQYTYITEEKKKIEGQEQTLKTKIHHINDMHNQCSTYIEKLNALHTLCTNNTHFVSCALTPANMEITLNCSTIEQAQICCNMLSKNLKGMHISSIMPKKHTLHVTFKN